MTFFWYPFPIKSLITTYVLHTTIYVPAKSRFPPSTPDIFLPSSPRAPTYNYDRTRIFMSLLTHVILLLQRLLVLLVSISWSIIIIPNTTFDYAYLMLIILSALAYNYRPLLTSPHWLILHSSLRSRPSSEDCVIAQIFIIKTILSINSILNNTRN